ncbi:MAG: hypothetical protein RLZZ618_3532 [Pseudomonadota bacterium]|jgi:DNA-binding GntR family transcriptional regulator
MDIEPAQRLLSGSLQDRIRHAVEADILSGVRPPGSAIDEHQLAQRFEASRTPVREALLVLAAQGLVHIVPRVGIYVRRASISELVASLEAMMEVESVLASMAAQRASAAQCEALRAALTVASAQAETNDVRAYAIANDALHSIIYEASGNPVMVEIVRNLRRSVAAYRRRSTGHPSGLKASDAEHREIVAAICRGDASAALAHMRQHISRGGEAVVRLVMAAQQLDAQSELLATTTDPQVSTATAVRRRRGPGLARRAGD